MRDRASKSLDSIERSAASAAKSTGMLSAASGRLMAAGGAFLGFHTAKTWLVDYNSQLENAQVTMSGLLQMNMGGEFAKNQKRANDLLKQFQQDAKASTATTKDFVDFAGLVVGPITRSGASMEDLREVTKGAVIAARAFGIEGEIAARDIEQALGGTLKAGDRFARALLEPYLKSQGVTKDFTKAWNAMTKADPARAAKELVKAFNQPAIANMAKAQEKSWAGVTSTLEDNLQRAVGKVGLPLMQAMSKEFEKLSVWFDKNPDKVSSIATSIANSLVSAFNAARDIMAFIVDNRRLLMTIAKAYLVGKVAGGLGSALATPFEMLSGTLANTNTSFLGFERGLKGVVSGMAKAAGILGVVAVGAQAIADYFDRKQDKRIKRETETTYLVERAQALAGMEGKQQTAARRAASREAARKGTMNEEIGGRYMYGSQIELAKDILTSARGAGAITGDGQVDVQRVLARYGRATQATFTGKKSAAEMQAQLDQRFRRTGLRATEKETWALKAVQGIEMALAYDREIRRRADEALRKRYHEMYMKHLLAGETIWNAGLKTAMTIAGVDVPEGAGKDAKDKNPWQTNVNAKVTIKQVVSDDPDRFAFNLIGAMESAANSSVQAKRALR